ncbi:MAG: hypothetical protein WCT77_01605 [Bacteroidota bacterium]
MGKRNLRNNIAELAKINVSLFERLHNLRKELRKEALNLRIRKCIVGKKGSGKTTFIKNEILPQLKNYFIIDFNDEYSDVVSDNNRFVDKSCSIQKIKKVIIENKNKVIIIEDIGLLIKKTSLLDDLLMRYDLDFIIISQCFENIIILQKSGFIDTIYDFGTIENQNYIDDLKLKTKTTIINLQKINKT